MIDMFYFGLFIFPDIRKISRFFYPLNRRSYLVIKSKYFIE